MLRVRHFFSPSTSLWCAPLVSRSLLLSISSRFTLGSSDISFFFFFFVPSPVFFLRAAILLFSFPPVLLRSTILVPRLHFRIRGFPNSFYSPTFQCLSFHPKSPSHLFSSPYWPLIFIQIFHSTPFKFNSFSFRPFSINIVHPHSDQ